MSHYPNTDAITEGSTNKFVTSAEKTKLSNLSGTNTGDQTSIVGITGTKAQFDTACTDGNFMYVGDVPTAHTHAIADVTGLQTALDGKQATLTNGFGITGTTTKAVALTTAEAFCTAETTLSAQTYADITGASISLAAGTWLILATINASSQSTTATVINAAITDNANAIIVEGAQHIVAGTATVRTWGNVTLSAIVSPGSTTTYKLRGARGTTTQTGNCIVSDGIGVNTANNVSNNSDKSTSIRAIRIA